MSSSRRAAPVDVYQDPRQPYDDDYLVESAMQHVASALQPAKAGALNQGVVLEPSTYEPSSTSPLKRPSPVSSPRIHGLENTFFDNARFPVPPLPPRSTDSLEKKANSSKQYQHIAQKPQKALFTTFPTTSADKENAYPASFFQRTLMPKSDPPVFSAQSVAFVKHPLSDCAPRDRSSKKQKVEEPEEQIIIPEPEAMPSLQDDGSRPHYSYATLIGMAILRAPERRLTLAQIYKWISDTFSFYRDAEPGWMNSIRHNLSLNKAFYKKERPKEDPGKGMYWHIVEGMEKQFLKEKSARSNGSKPPVFLPSETADSLYAQGSLSFGNGSAQQKQTRTIDSSTFPGEGEISSDATLPASDAAVQEQEFEQEISAALPAETSLRSSPPPPEMHSSPPVARHVASRGGTPPPPLRFPSNSRSGGRAKRVDNFRDSGFYSSIDSSAVRATQVPGTFLTSEADFERPVVKHGRAEDEIARIRGSSYDPSPTKSKAKGDKSSTYLAFSSPLRFDSTNFPPLTPNVKLDPPTKAAPAVSPNTYLRRHRESIRELIGTPGQGLAAIAEDLAWTPAFTIHDENSNSSAVSHLPSEDGNITSPELQQLRDDDFDGVSTFDDALFDDLFNQESPIKRHSASAKRPGLQRFATTTGARVLGDVSSSRQNARLASPIRLLPPSEKKQRSSFASPSKKDAVAARENPDRLDDVFGLSPSSEGDKAGMDLTHGFQKIGGVGKENEQAGSGKKGVGKRPPLGRSMTNVF